jgi:hypothetical protein
MYMIKCTYTYTESEHAREDLRKTGRERKRGSGGEKERE